jgi:Domain of unknown function (DUF5911)
MLTTAVNDALAANVTVPTGVEAIARNGNLTLTGMVHWRWPISPQSASTSRGGIRAVNCLYHRPTSLLHRRALPAPDNLKGTDMDPYPSIGDHGLTGDLQTGALVTTDGTVDWFCCPRLDSPSAFASMATPGSVFTCRRHSGTGPLRSSIWCRVFQP